MAFCLENTLCYFQSKSRCACGSRYDVRLAQVAKFAGEGWSVNDILAHFVTGYLTVILGRGRRFLACGPGLNLSKGWASTENAHFLIYPASLLIFAAIRQAKINGQVNASAYFRDVLISKSYASKCWLYFTLM